MILHNIGNCYILGNSKFPKYVTLSVFVNVLLGIFLFVNSEAHLGSSALFSNFPLISIFYLLGITNLLFFIILGYNWLLSLSMWEAQKFETTAVQKNITQGFYLFAISEVMLFFGFFWAFFHFAWAPSVELGGVWPPVFISTVNPFGLPVLNTILLISSGFLLSIALKANSSGELYASKIMYYMAILSGICFLLVQRVEFLYAGFLPSQSIFGSVFFGLTSLHGFHVVLGLLGLVLFLFQIENSYSIPLKFQIKYSSSSFFKQYNFKGSYRDQVIGGYLAAFYWHLVDAIWIFLVVVLYFNFPLILLLKYIVIISGISLLVKKIKQKYL